jgi:hypothetical protein
MAEDGDGDGGDGGDQSGGGSIPPRHETPYYHGDSVRVIFVVSAIVLIVAQSTGAELPISAFGAVTLAVVLVIAAGVTNPAQNGIHWLNALIAIAGTLLFGVTVIDRYREGVSFFDPSFVYAEALALLSLLALYFTTQTIHGIRMRGRLNYP